MHIALPLLDPARDRLDPAVPFLMRPKRHADARGWFAEVWHGPRMAAAGLDIAFVQDNHSASHAAGTLRGLHYQGPPAAQAKIVRCVRGAVYDAIVDARPDSPGFGRWAGVEIGADDGVQLFVPAGFLHGFLTLCDGAEIVYRCSAPYDPGCEGAVRWDSCGIDWPLVGRAPILSPRDAEAPAFADWTSPFGGAP
ncbi:MAG: dTDP-4-dehydrorhamnose 3,5-epimerase RfbC [Pseudomonadota bacterium]